MTLKNLEDVYQLAPMQKGMLFHALLEPDSGVYFNQSLWHFSGALNLRAFRQAWQRVMARHSILRTGFFWKGLAEPQQVVYRQLDVPLTVLDWRNLPASMLDSQLNALLNEDRQATFQLNKAPLIRLTLIQTSETDWYLVWSRHHILLDGWSQVIVLREAFVLYEVFCYGENVEYDETMFMPASQPFKQYIAWLARQNSASTEIYWRQYLAGINAPTPVATPQTSADQPVDYQSLVLNLRESTTDALRHFLGQHGLTLNTFAQGLWGIVLSQFSQCNDVLFGITVAGRPTEVTGIEHMVGLFINTLPLRIVIEPATPFLEWLHTLQREQATMRQFEATPIMEIQGLSDIPRTAPMFESILVFENFPQNSIPQESTTVRIRHVRSAIQNSLPLTVRAIPNRALGFEMMFDQQRVAQAHVQAFLEQFELICSHIVDEDMVYLSDVLSLLDAWKAQQNTAAHAAFQQASTQKLRALKRASATQRRAEPST